MNRIVLAIVAIIYFGLSIRATVHLHDCMDIFAGSGSDIHSEEKEKAPCQNDPSQCKMETQRRVIEAPSNWLRAIDAALFPVSVFHIVQRFYISRQSSYNSRRPKNIGAISLLSLHCLWRI